MSDKISPVPDLFCVNIQRHPRDLGVSIVLQATSELIARREVLRLFPEFKHGLVLMAASHVRYAELDWDNGRFIVAKRDHPANNPGCIVNPAKPNLRRLPPSEQEGTE